MVAVQLRIGRLAHRGYTPHAPPFAPALVGMHATHQRRDCVPVRHRQRMKTPPHFLVGDRVRLIYPLAGVTTGTTGTVVLRFIGSSLCDVQFDGHIGTRVVDGRKLALVPPARAPGTGE